MQWRAVDHVLLDMDGTVLDLAFDNHFWRDVVRGARPSRKASRPNRPAPSSSRISTRCRAGCSGTASMLRSELTRLDLAAINAEIRAPASHRSPAPNQTSCVRSRQAAATCGRCTNAHRNSWALKMEQTGLGAIFDRIVCSHDFNAPKEDAGVLDAAAGAPSVRAGPVLFVDDRCRYCVPRAPTASARCCDPPARHDAPLRDITQHTAVRSNSPTCYR